MNLDSVKYLVVSLHDVHPASFKLVRRQIEFCRRMGVHRTALLVVPDFHQQGSLEQNMEFVNWLLDMQRRGHEIVLHGYYHQRTRIQPSEKQGKAKEWFWTKFYTDNEAEFYNMTEDEAADRFLRGYTLLASLGLQSIGFIAPAWLISNAALTALWKSHGHYTTTINKIITADGIYARSQSLCWSARSAWRRSASLIYNNWLWSKVRRDSLVRVALHPHDLKHGAIKRQITSILRSAIRGGFQAVTYQELVPRKMVALKPRPAMNFTEELRSSDR